MSHDARYTVVYSLEALGQLRALPEAVRAAVQARGEELAALAKGGPASPARSPLRHSFVDGCQLLYEVLHSDRTLRVVRLMALATGDSGPGLAG